MRTFFRILPTALVLLSSPAAEAGTRWANGIAASKVIGQPDFTSNTGTNTVDRTRFPEDVAVDPTTGKVFVADTGNNRVLRFASFAALTNGASAEAVIGQNTFEATGGSSAQDGLFAPSGVYVDAAGRLWVADRNNNRILRYDDAASLTDGPLANGILGQTGYGVFGAGTSDTRVFNPIGIIGDAAGNIFVVDFLNNRVLMFADAANLADSSPAALVLGQEDFSGTGVATQQDNFFSPSGITVDAAGNLYVADTANNRVLRFDAAASKNNGDDADAVFGQINFNTGTAGDGTTGLNGPRGVTVDGEGRLWVADTTNDRILGYDNAATAGNGEAADYVIGRPDFTLDAPAEVSASRVDGPRGLGVDAAGRLHVSDRENSRLLIFEKSLFRPDLTIGAKVASQRGRSVFNSNGAAQKQVTVSKKGKLVKFPAFVRNGGTATDRYALSATKPNKQFDVKVFRVTGGRLNVSAATRTGLHQTTDLAFGGAEQYEMQMKPKGKFAKKKGTSKAFLQGRSLTDSSIDRVLAWIKRKP